MAALGIIGISGKQLARRVVTRIGNHDVFGGAAQLAYYFFLALFPMLLFLLSAVALVSGKGSSVESNLISYIGRVAPPDATGLIQKTIAQTFDASGGLKAMFAIIGALWAGSQGVASLMGTLNCAYNVQETRPFWKRRALALWVTIAGSLLITIGVALLTVGQTVASRLTRAETLVVFARWIWYLAEWPVIVVLLLVAFGIIYYWVPNAEHPQWHWITPGAIVALTLWFIASFGLRYYLEFFNTYSRTYGALTAVIVILLWFYVTGAAILIGGEVNSEVEQANRGGAVCAWCGNKMAVPPE